MFLVGRSEKGIKGGELKNHPYFCPFFYFGRYFQFAVIGRYNFHCQAESDSLSCIVVGIAAPVERLEDMLYFFLRDTDSPVFYFNHDLSVYPGKDNVYFLFRIFACIVYDVLQGYF